MLEWLYCFEVWLTAQQQHHEKTYQIEMKTTSQEPVA